MQGDDGLAGARAAGDLGDAAGGRPDRLVLVAWMVATMSRMRAPRVRVSAAISAPSPTTTRSVGRLGDHQVVLDADDVGALAAQHPAAEHAHRLDRGGAVERRGGRRAPVDDQRLVVVVAHAEPADVAHLALGGAVAVGHVVVEVEPAEDQAFVLALQGVAAPGGVEHQGVALEQPGELLVADVAGAVGTPAGQAVGLDEAGAGAALASSA